MKMNFKVICLTAPIFMISIQPCFGQNLEKGSYEIGFQIFKTYDDTRPYVRNMDTISRPLLIHFWYPSHEKLRDRGLVFKDYIDLIALREDFDIVSTEVAQSSYNYINAYSEFAKRMFGLDTLITTQQLLDCPVSAHKSLAIAADTTKFPLIIYAPSNSKSSVQNHLICEYLASHGYMILSVGSAGPNSIQRESAPESTLAQVTDMEYILHYFVDSLNMNYSNLGLFGFSSGGLATSIFQMRNKSVKAVFSMDGGHEYGSYQSLFKMEDFDLEKTDVPYCLVVNNYENFSIYPYYNSIITTEKQMYRMPYLDHNGFISYWRFFDSCSAGSATNKISTSYETICDCALHFFNHFLKPDLPKSDEAGLSSSANEYIQPVIQNNASIACLCNLILANHMDSVMCLLDENRTTYLGKENEINILARFLIDHHIDHSIQLYLYNLENHPDSWETLYNLGVAYKEKGEPLLSRSALLKAQELNPQNSDITDLLNE